jgi:hypothetical protein
VAAGGSAQRVSGASSADAPGTIGSPGADDRRVWIDRCADRLAALAAGPVAVPEEGFEHWRELATEMWEEVGSFDPFIAAEMESEASRLDD